MNLIVICADTLRYDVVRHAHPVAVATPALDALARESAVFTAAYGEGEPTIPVRRAFFTGMRSFPWRFAFDTAGLWPTGRGWHRIPPEQPTLAEVLLQHGYKTALFSDTYHTFKPTMNFTRGFVNYEFIRGQESDNWKGGSLASIAAVAKRHVAGELNPAEHAVLLAYLFNNRWRTNEENWTSARVFRAAMDWLDDNHRDTPFFLWVESFDPHEPWDPPREYANRYYPDLGERGKEYIFHQQATHATPEEQERMKALYYGEVTFVDRWIGRIYEKLNSLKLLDDTVVMFVTDHGTELLDHGRFGKSAPHLFAHNTQLLWFIRHPDGSRQGQEIGSFVQNHDLFPTVLEVLGLPARNVDGQSAWPLVTGSATRTRDHIITGWGSYASVRDRFWNYTVNFEEPEADTRLYDLVNDPKEQRNVAPDRPETVAQKRAMLEEFLGQPLPARLPDQVFASNAPTRAYYGSRATREQQESGFV